jgi:hypothetical protein
MTIPRLKSILVSENGKLSESGLDKKLTMILNGYGMKKYANLIQEGRATLPQIIQSENYFLTNIDIWILAMYFKIPIALISQSLLSENGENMMVLYGGNDAIYGYNNYFFIHPFTVTQDIPTRYGLIEVKHNDISLLTIPLEFLSLNIRNKIENYDTRDLRIEEYIQNFKLSLIKHKKRVFTFTEPPIAAAALPENTDTEMFQ